MKLLFLLFLLLVAQPQVEGQAGKVVLNSPVGKARISSKFMAKRECRGCSAEHGGTDYAVKTDTKVVATAQGIIARAYESSTYGNVVIVDHGTSVKGNGNVYTLYAHGRVLTVKEGQTIKAGELLMYSDNSGKSTAPHLHYEVIVTSYKPSEPEFFQDLKIRHSPSELSDFLVKL